MIEWIDNIKEFIPLLDIIILYLYAIVIGEREGRLWKNWKGKDIDKHSKIKLDYHALRAVEGLFVGIVIVAVNMNHPLVLVAHALIANLLYKMQYNLVKHNNPFYYYNSPFKIFNITIQGDMKRMYYYPAIAGCIFLILWRLLF